MADGTPKRGYSGRPGVLCLEGVGTGGIIGTKLEPNMVVSYEEPVRVYIKVGGECTAR